jgi:hypothetical protein
MLITVSNHAHHKDPKKFINTNHYVVKKQLTPKLKINDNFVNDLINDQLKGSAKFSVNLAESSTSLMQNL